MHKPLASINIFRFEDQYPVVFPNGVAKDSSVYKGYKIFKGRCIGCHAINQEGRKIGSDLKFSQKHRDLPLWTYDI